MSELRCTQASTKPCCDHKHDVPWEPARVRERLTHVLIGALLFASCWIEIGKRLAN